MNAIPIPSKIEQLRARHGDRCWLCDGKLDFDAPPNSKKAPTKEHLVALSKGGTSALDNLVLCHPGCNRQLGDRPKANKIAMREKKIAARRRQSLTVGHSPVSVVHEPADRRWQWIAIAASIVAAFALGLAAGLLLAR